MKIMSINEARRFSLDGVQTRELLSEDGLSVNLLCFEAGQQDALRSFAGPVVYQVIEGEAVVERSGTRDRLGKGKVMVLPAGTGHHLENAGGGLLVVMATRAEPARPEPSEG